MREVSQGKYIGYMSIKRDEALKREVETYAKETHSGYPNIYLQWPGSRLNAEIGRAHV